MTTAALRPRVLGRRDISASLEALGLSRGQDVLVHCSMRRIGRVDGGAVTIAQAIRDVLGPHGTVVVPAQTPNNSVSSDAFREATRGMSVAEVAAYEDRMAGFDPALTPSYRMGVLAEHVRRQPDAVRSKHPQASFAACGPMAGPLMAVHDLDCHLGERSPLAALYEAGASVLLLGVGYESCTAFHLAEHRLRRRPAMRAYRCYENVDGQRIRRDFAAPDLDASAFGDIGAAFDGCSLGRSAVIGDATSRLLPIRAAVEFAIRWMDSRSQP